MIREVKRLKWSPLDHRAELRLSIATTDEFCADAYKLNYEFGATHVIRLVRGKKMQSVSDLYDEFAAAFQFPCYFGENWDAFDECIADLEWLPGEGYVLLVLNAADVLSKEPAQELETFWRIISGAIEEWRTTGQKPFHVLLQCDEGDVRRMQQQFNEPVEVLRHSELT